MDEILAWLFPCCDCCDRFRDDFESDHSPTYTFSPLRRLLVPLEPPTPKPLNDPSAFTGPNAPKWAEIPQFYGTRFHELNDPRTGHQAHLSMRCRLWVKEAIPNYVRKGSIKGRKLIVECESPGPVGGAADAVFRECVERLEQLKRDLERDFPSATQGIQETYGSFVKWAPGGIPTVRIQQQLDKRESHLYKLNVDPYLAYIVKYGNLPEDCTSVIIPVHQQDTSGTPSASPSKPGSSRADASSPASKSSPIKKVPTIKTPTPFDINFFPAYYKDGTPVKPKDLKSISGMLADVVFCLCHTRPNGGDHLPRAFIARPVAIRLVESVHLKAKEVKKEAKKKGVVKQARTGEEDDLEGEDAGSGEEVKGKGKGKRKAEDDDDDYVEVPKANGKRRVVEVVDDDAQHSARYPHVVTIDLEKETEIVISSAFSKAKADPLLAKTQDLKVIGSTASGQKVALMK
ncbi:hypothetical protein BJ165DRAFT_1410517 [Panaeolus papilionaceus]|nr:hypothetical protein BJ165DRAFT_1410517 [Panaeolus papilionaceus]